MHSCLIRQINDTYANFINEATLNEGDSLNPNLTDAIFTFNFSVVLWNDIEVAALVLLKESIVARILFLKMAESIG